MAKVILEGTNIYLSAGPEKKKFEKEISVKLE
jgi:hypothetical protein